MNVKKIYVATREKSGQLSVMIEYEEKVESARQWQHPWVWMLKMGVSSLKWKRRIVVGATALFLLVRVLLVRTISYTRGTSKMMKQQSHSQNVTGMRVC